MLTETPTDLDAPVATTTGTYAVIGTDSNDAPVIWRLADEVARPCHGLIVGWSGAGATVLIGHLMTTASRMGMDTWCLDAHVRDPHPAADRHQRDAEGFFADLEQRVQLHLSEGPGPAPLLVVIDHPAALTEHQHAVQFLAAMGADLGVGVVVRVNDLHNLSRELRALTSAHQYLVFDYGSHTPQRKELAPFLPGYRIKAPFQSWYVKVPRVADLPTQQGRGNYGRGGHSRSVVVRAPHSS